MLPRPTRPDFVWNCPTRIWPAFFPHNTALLHDRCSSCRRDKLHPRCQASLHVYFCVSSLNFTWYCWTSIIWYQKHCWFPPHQAIIRLHMRVLLPKLWNHKKVAFCVINMRFNRNNVRLSHMDKFFFSRQSNSLH